MLLFCSKHWEEECCEVYVDVCLVIIVKSSSLCILYSCQSPSSLMLAREAECESCLTTVNQVCILKFIIVHITLMTVYHMYEINMFMCIVCSFCQWISKV